MSLRTNDQNYIGLEDSEAKIAYRYLSLLEKYGLKVTFYITGRTFAEEWDDIKPVIKSKLVEVGGLLAPL